MLDSIKSGRASSTMFDDLEVKAYGETHFIKDLASTSVQGTNTLLLKVFDETVKDEVLKTLSRTEFEMSVQLEGKDIKIKLGTSRKEHVAAGLKKIKAANEEFKKNVRDARHKVLEVIKKLSKVVPQETTTLLEAEIATKIKKAEDLAKKTVESKEKDLN